MRDSTDKHGTQAIAGLKERFVAQLLDSFIGFAPLVAFSVAAFALDLDEAFKGWVLILGIAFTIVYMLFADGMSRGQSWGKKLLSIAVVDERTGGPCRYGQSFVRNFCMWLTVIDWVFIFGRSRQRLGDIFAKTIVVYVPRD